MKGTLMVLDSFLPNFPVCIDAVLTQLFIFTANSLPNTA